MEKQKSKPTAFRLGRLKAPLQQEAMTLDRSLHWLVIKILSVHVDGPESKKKKVVKN